MLALNSSLGDRMKSYEFETRNFLQKKTPVIIRVDGKAFHTYTKPFKTDSDPYNCDIFDSMYCAMQQTHKAIQGCVVSYMQSDECSFLVLDTKAPETQAYFGYELPKIVSIVASTFTVNFYSTIQKFIAKKNYNVDRLPIFDARAFNIPFEDMSNYFVWRIKDAERNAIQNVARYVLGHKKIQGVPNVTVKQMLTEVGVDFDSLPLGFQRGVIYNGEANTLLKTSTFKEVEEIIKQNIEKYKRGNNAEAIPDNG